MKKIALFFLVICLFGCKDKLDLKPNTSIVLPKTAQELESILEYSDILNYTPAFGQVSADEYFIPSHAEWQACPSATARNAAIWQADIYAGETRVDDWNVSYTTIFYANSVLDILATQDISNDLEKQRVKGRALFMRAYAFYSIASIFSKAYDATTANLDLGIPLKLNGSVEEIVQRSSVQKTYDQIITDVTTASDLLNQDIIKDKRNQPSKVAAFALLARVYLSMRKYDQAEFYADKALSLYSKLTDFNTLNPTATSAFSYNSEETIYFSTTLTTYGYFYQTNGLYGIDPGIINLYEPNDLRLTIYFKKNVAGNYRIKPINNLSELLFSGLATDELYLIKSECLARRGQAAQSMDYLNQLGIKRWNPNATTPAKIYENITAATPEIALEKILVERKKALIFRSLRWTDLKRLNLEGKNIVLTRNLSGQIFTLEPNSAKYILPIPEDEILISKIKQNQR